MYNSNINNSTKVKNKKLNVRHTLLVAFILCLIIFSCIVAKRQVSAPPSHDASTDSYISVLEKFSTIKKSDVANDVAQIEDTPELEKASIVYNTLTDEQINDILNIYKVSPAKTVYLTFDDGPSNSVTPLILDVLKERNIKATFFVLGTNVDSYPSIVQREFAEGHYIANHGYSHKYSEIYVSTDTILNDYLKCNTALQNALNNANFSSSIYRFPGGSSGRSV